MNQGILEVANERRQSQRPEDLAFMQHWNSCSKTMPPGQCCSIYGLCPEGQRLDLICEAELQPVLIEKSLQALSRRGVQASADQCEIRRASQVIWLVIASGWIVFLDTRGGTHVYHMLPLSAVQRRGGTDE